MAEGTSSVESLSLPKSTGQVTHLHQESGIPVGGAIVVNTEALPPEIASEIKTNPYAVDILPGAFKRLATNEGLLALARLALPPSAKKTERVLANATMGRTLPLAYSNKDGIPYKNLVGRIIIGKGVGPSGCFATPEEHGLDKFTKQDADPDTPWGFFGGKGAEQETAMSNALIANGARSALTLGYISMNPDKLGEYLEKRWTAQHAGFLKSRISRIVEKGESPVILVRLGGTLERMNNYPRALNMFGGMRVDLLDKEQLNKRDRAALAIAARIFLREMFLSPKEFQNNYLWEIPTGQAKQIFEKIGSYTPLDPKESLLFSRLICQINAYEKSAVTATILQNPSWFNLAASYGEGRDTDMALIHQDYESVKPGDPQTVSAVAQAADLSLSKLAEEYLNWVAWPSGISQKNPPFPEHIKKVNNLAKITYPPSSQDSTVVARLKGRLFPKKAFSGTI